VVPEAGLEPACREAADFESAASTIPPLGRAQAPYCVRIAAATGERGAAHWRVTGHDPCATVAAPAAPYRMARKPP
jgi:hypothetical protein